MSRVSRPAPAGSSSACCRTERVLLSAPTPRVMRSTVSTVGAAPHEKKLVAITIWPPAVVEANRHDPRRYSHDALREGRVFYYVVDVAPLDPE